MAANKNSVWIAMTIWKSDVFGGAFLDGGMDYFFKTLYKRVKTFPNTDYLKVVEQE